MALNRLEKHLKDKLPYPQKGQEHLKSEWAGKFASHDKHIHVGTHSFGNLISQSKSSWAGTKLMAHEGSQDIEQYLGGYLNGRFPRAIYEYILPNDNPHHFLQLGKAGESDFKILKTFGTGDLPPVFNKEYGRISNIVNNSEMRKQNRFIRENIPGIYFFAPK